jgi:hypothetical protein
VTGNENGPQDPRGVSPFELERVLKNRALDAADEGITIADSATFEETHLDLSPGDRPFFYSDGVTEARAPTGCEFGVETLLARVADTRGLPLQTAEDAIIAAVESHCGDSGVQDDVSLLAAESVPPESPAGSGRRVAALPAPHRLQRRAAARVAEQPDAVRVRSGAPETCPGSHGRSRSGLHGTPAKPARGGS